VFPGNFWLLWRPSPPARVLVALAAIPTSQNSGCFGGNHHQPESLDCIGGEIGSVPLCAHVTRSRTDISNTGGVDGLILGDAGGDAGFVVGDPGFSMGDVGGLEERFGGARWRTFMGDVGADSLRFFKRTLTSSPLKSTLTFQRWAATSIDCTVPTLPSKSTLVCKPSKITVLPLTMAVPRMFGLEERFGGALGFITGDIDFDGDDGDRARLSGGVIGSPAGPRIFFGDVASSKVFVPNPLFVPKSSWTLSMTLRMCSGCMMPKSSC